MNLDTKSSVGGCDDDPHLSQRSNGGLPEPREGQESTGGSPPPNEQ